MKQHDLKCYPPYFEAVDSGVKMFECRYNDRDFQVGDELLLREYGLEIGYTGRILVKKIVYMLSDFCWFEKWLCYFGDVINGRNLYLRRRCV